MVYPTTFKFLFLFFIWFLKMVLHAYVIFCNLSRNDIMKVISYWLSNTIILYSFSGTYCVQIMEYSLHTKYPHKQYIYFDSFIKWDTKTWLELNEYFPSGDNVYDSASVYNWIENRFVCFKYPSILGMPSFTKLQWISIIFLSRWYK